MVPSQPYDLQSLARSVSEQNNGPSILGLLCAATVGLDKRAYPHHPINCHERETQYYTEDDIFGCEHSKVDALTDERTQAAIRLSICHLIMTEAFKL